MADLSDIEHLLLIIAEDVPLAALRSVPTDVTTCRAYHLTPEGEDRAQRVWPAYAVQLREAHHTVHLRASVPDTLGDITVIEANQATVESVIDSLDQLPEATLVAIALAGGEAAPVEDEYASLGAPGTLLLHTPGSHAWVSEEICDHTSLIQLCERWTALRGREARARLTAWRRRVCGDLVGALDLGEPAPEPVEGRLPARPLPYQPEAALEIDEAGAVALLLSNAGPYASRGVPLTVDDGAATTTHVVPSSPAERSKEIAVPVMVTDGRYDVTVTGPNGFRRRYAGPVAGEVRGSLLRVADGETETDHGWYAVTLTPAPDCLQEYAGHLETGAPSHV